MNHRPSRALLALVVVSLAVAGCTVAELPGAESDASRADTHAPDDTRAADTAVAPVKTWSTVLEDLPAALLSVWGSGTDDIWLTGADAGDGTGPWVVHGTAAGWQRIDLRDVDPDGGHVWWVTGPDDAAVWLAGEDGRVFRYDRALGAAEAIVTDTNATLYGIWGASDDALWAVGGYVHPETGPPTVVRITDGVGEVVTLPDSLEDNVTLFKVWGSAADDVWVCGTGGTLLHWDGMAWTHQVLPGAPRLVTVHGRSAEDVVAVGGNAQAAIVRFDGDTWEDDSPGQYHILNGVYVAPDGTAAAAGFLGQAFLRADGAWEAVDDLLNQADWHGVWIDPRGDVWLAGGNLLSANALDAGTVTRYGPARADLPTGEVTGPSAVAEPVADASTGDADAGPTDTRGDDTLLLVDSQPADSGPADTGVPADSGPADTGEPADTDAGDTASVPDADGTDVSDTNGTAGQNANPDLVIGRLGSSGYESLAPDATLEIVQGVQGGVHIEVVLEFPYASSDDRASIVIDLGTWIDGVKVGSYASSTYPAPRVGTDVFRTYTIPIVFTTSGVADPFVGETARIEARIARPDQVVVETSLDVELVDEF